jgi:thermostable 8-oxoguanine DNA glycosylase
VFQESARFSAADIEALLTEPFIEFGAARRYRFPRQRAMRLHGALRTLKAGNPPAQPLQLRDWLLQVPGIGPKTASWVVRNHTASNEVAIIDIHIIRAGTAAGVFDHRWRVERDYEQFEHAFLHWARHGEIAASLLDACVWGVLAHAGSDSRDILGTTRLSVAPQPVWPVDG